MGRYGQNQIPLEAQVLYRRAKEMSSHGNYLNALRIFSKAIFIAPCFARAQYEMGCCLDNLGRHHEAIERYDKAMQINPLHIHVQPVTDTFRKQ